MVLTEKKKAKSGDGSADAADKATKIILVGVQTHKFIVVPWEPKILTDGLIFNLLIYKNWIK